MERREIDVVGKIIADTDLTGWSLVGKVRHAHGLKGELFFVFFAQESSWLGQISQLNVVRTERDAEGKTIRKLYVFDKKRTKPHKVGAIVKVDGIENRTQAEDFTGAQLFIPDVLITSKSGEKLFLREVSGFEVVFPDGRAIGHVAGFSSNNAQDLLIIKTGRGTAEVPFIEPFVMKTDLQAKIITMDFPEDLLELTGQANHVQDDGQNELEDTEEYNTEKLTGDADSRIPSNNSATTSAVLE